MRVKLGTGLILAVVIVVVLGAGCMPAIDEKHTMPSIRVATFNVSMEARNYTDKEEALDADTLRRELKGGENVQISAIAEIIQRVRPDIVLLNEFDFSEPAGEDAALFLTHYLHKSQAGQLPIDYPYYYSAPVNTGELMPLNTDGDGTISAPADTYGFGFFPGHYGMLLLSRFPIDEANIHTFRKFLWHEMPGAQRPAYPDGKPFYSDVIWQSLRLSSKSHWDIPVIIGEHKLHILASHPTPPVFDGLEDRNGKRNNDEIRLWVDYLSGEADYLYDDKGHRADFNPAASFVVLGDLNASATQGDGQKQAILDLLHHLRVQDPLPQSLGGAEARPGQAQAKYHTASWGMRVDYVLPSANLSVTGSGVFWPSKEDPLARLTERRQTSSDHRLVWADISW